MSDSAAAWRIERTSTASSVTSPPGETGSPARTCSRPSRAGVHTPVHRAAWNTTVSLGPRRSIARPGARRGKRAGASSPTTSRASALSCRRRARRRLVLARMSSLTTPAGRCVASTRWTPRLRPRWARPTSCRGTSAARRPARRTRRSRRRGAAAADHGRTTGTRRGRMAPTARRMRSRRRNSASRLVSARSASRSSRSVTSPTVCGRSAQASNVAPPL